MKAALFAMVLLLSGALAAQTPSRPQQNLHIPEGMKQYFFGFLVKGEKWAQTPPHEELHQLMQQHLAYIRSQAEAGKYALAGPFLDNDRIRGIAIMMLHRLKKPRTSQAATPWCRVEGWR